MSSTIKQLQFDRQLDLMQVREFRRTGNLETLAGLYNKYIHLTYGLCIKYLGDRIQARASVQEIFEKVTVEIVKKEVTHFKPWLYALSKKHCLKKLGQASGIDTHLEPKVYEKSHPIDDDIRLTDSLAECISKLVRKQKQGIDLFYRKNKCYREIGLKMNLGEKEVKQLIDEAKQKILIDLEEHAKNQKLLNSD